MRKYICNQTYPQGIRVQNIEFVQLNVKKTKQATQEIKGPEMETDLFQEGTGTPMRHKTRCSSPLLVTGPSEGPGTGSGHISLNQKTYKLSPENTPFIDLLKALLLL